MNSISLRKFVILLTALALPGLFGPGRVCAQPGAFAPPPNQRQLLEQLEMQLKWIDNATRNVHMFNTAPDTVLWQNFEGLRVSFQVLKDSLNPRQLQRGANELAELEAGLAIISEAFANFQNDLNAGRPPAAALRTLCQVLRDSTKLWGQELNRVARMLQVGR